MRTCNPVPRFAGEDYHFWTGQLDEWDLLIDHNGGWVPRDIAVNATSHVFVLLVTNEGGGNACVQVFSPSGDFLFQWGRSGAGPGQFANPYGLEINKTGYIYVADTLNNRVQVFSPWGTFLYAIGSAGLGDGEFNFPVGIAINSTGFVYVSDGYWRVQEFAPDGMYVRKWQGHGSGPGMFESPHAIAINDSNHVYVIDGGNENFQVFSPGGQYLYTQDSPIPGEMGFLLTPAFLNRTGHLLFAYQTTGYAKLCSQTGELIFSFRPEYSPFGSEYPSLVEALTVDGQDRVYTTGSVDYKVHVFSPPYAPQAPAVQVPWWGLSLSGRVDLAWATCGGAVTYRVYRAPVPITAINSSVILLGEIAGTSWAEDRSPGEYYYAIGAVNEFTESISAPTRVLVVGLIPGLPPLAGLVIVLSIGGVTGAILLVRWRKHRKIRSLTPVSGS